MPKIVFRYACFTQEDDTDPDSWVEKSICHCCGNSIYAGYLALESSEKERHFCSEKCAEIYRDKHNE